jgi:hypothetical protein
MMFAVPDMTLIECLYQERLLWFLHNQHNPPLWVRHLAEKPWLDFYALLEDREIWE